MASSSSSSSSKRRRRCDVFCTFDGGDNHSFLGHLYAALEQRGIHIFMDLYMDSEELRKGEQILPPRMEAIEESRVVIVVFSIYYTMSHWFLEDMVKIMECKEQRGLMVFPVFYNVNAVLVRKQLGCYGDAMAILEDDFGKDSEKVKRWKNAPFEAGSLAGWHFTREDSEAKLFQDIVKTIFTQTTKFDVFLNFRGKDVRKFVKSLNEALVQKGINTFMDSESIRVGHDFPQALKEAIEQSRMYVVIFSEHYAESSWCLKELVEIIEKKNGKNRLMLPVFYKVEPSEVRRQKRSYDEALDKHEINYGERPHTVKKWREALTEAANMQGTPLCEGNEDGWIPRIAEETEKMVAEFR